YLNALHLFPAKTSTWIPQVLSCSAQSGQGILEVWETIMHYAQHTRQNGFFDENRSQQALFWLKETLQEALIHRFYTHPDVKILLQQLEPIVVAGKVSPFAAAEVILKVWDK
ncbi:MAG: methylmalonyl Co-A mutase-associated GTPase MeaB, partial [Saprospiraceae bacterium]